LALVSWAFWVWAAPTFIGIWTQIRKGLPRFARAPRTIIAAGNYESHRLLYVAVLIVLWMVLHTLLRTAVPGVYLPFNAAGLMSFLPYFCTGVGLLCVAGIAAGGWIGPLRSDYTKQLIRSRWHAARVLIMYALVFPWIMAILCMAIISMVAELILGVEPW
jgi:hypothetical protein